MAYHISLLGPVSGYLQRCSDLDGLVPEPGDHWQSFRWDQRILRELADPDHGTQRWTQWLLCTQEIRNEAVQNLQILEGWDTVHYGQRWGMGRSPV
ncbi:MAG TPA: hypothetical protein V6D46_03055 [Coleofasciculaceae cyanobacterium]